MTFATRFCDVAADGSTGCVVETMIEGLLAVYPNVFARLDGFAEKTRVVVRRDIEAAKRKGLVSVISGGGAGHEPAHAGYVGSGMLTAAVSGDIFASPTTAAVLKAVLATTAPPECQNESAKGDYAGGGCVLIIKNYTGDRINFGLASETAKSEHGLQVETVFVADDVALPGAAQPRGIAGTVLVHKVAGALAARGVPLATVAAAARSVAAAVKSLGVSASTCTIPGQPAVARLAPGEIEVGLGIHGEPGARVATNMSVTSVVTAMLTPIFDAIVAHAGAAAAVPSRTAPARVALLVNDLGRTTPMELAVVTKIALEQCRERGLEVALASTGRLMTALDMHGVSLSVLRLDTSLGDALPGSDELEALLAASTEAPFWAPFATPSAAAPLVLPLPAAENKIWTRPSGALSPAASCLEASIAAACRALSAAEPELTAMDLKVGDGDCGHTMRGGAEKVLADMAAHYPLESPVDTLSALAQTVETAMGGSSGVLFLLGFKAAAGALKQRGITTTESCDTAAWAAAFCAFADAISLHGGAGIGSRTMCDAIIPASEVFRTGGSFVEAVAACRKGADGTKQLVATHGRSAYVPAENQSSVADPGAIAVAILLETAVAVASAAP